ncbi:MAG: PLP-dependent aminotransferase family protein [Thermoleophilaceae bacterium]|nr:PLP-dependent aminotransferase family protein [Thermoleophilaceae bacterium]
MSKDHNNSDIERYSKLYARRAHEVKSSAMRDLMSITDRPEIISLAGGLPDTSTFPADVLESVLVTLSRTLSAEALQYGPTEGNLAIKACVSDVMRAEGMSIEPDQMIVTTGGQQVIDLVTRTLIDPGDIIIAEAPTYPGAVPSFTSFQANVIQIDVDADGMRIDQLEATLARLDAEGKRAKFIYTIPTFQNPAGVTMSLPRRKRLVEIARKRELLVLEDNPYSLLRYEGEPLPTLYSLDGGEYVMYLGTFSKIISPGLRIGWLVAPSPVLQKVNLGKQAADLCTSSMTSYLVSTYFAQANWRDYVDSVVDIYRARRDVMLAALEQYFPPEASWTRPEGGLFIWVTLPEVINTTSLLAKALSENVAFVPGGAAYTDGRGQASMRLNFSGVGEDQIKEGVRRIGKVIGEQLSLLRSMGVDTAAASDTSSSAAEPGEKADVVSLPARRHSNRRAEEA